MFDMIWVFAATVLGSYLSGTESAIYFGTGAIAGLALGRYINWRRAQN